ncbi:hypothetical protein [Hydrogenimonas sp.]
MAGPPHPGDGQHRRRFSVAAVNKGDRSAGVRRVPLPILQGIEEHNLRPLESCETRVPIRKFGEVSGNDDSDVTWPQSLRSSVSRANNLTTLSFL